MDRTTAWEHVDRERAALAGILADLSPEEWATPSLCQGWTVRDVAAHVISSPQATWASTARAFVRGRGSFNRTIHLEATRLARRPTTEIVADFARLTGSRRHPPGTSYLDPLLDILVHTQDIVLPLGRTHAMPPEAAAAAARRVQRLEWLFHGRRRSRGLRLVATDADWSAGSGAVVERPMQDLLLHLTGRVDVRPA